MVVSEFADYVEGLHHVSAEEIVQGDDAWFYADLQSPLNGFSMAYINPATWTGGACGCLVPHALSFMGHELWYGLHRVEAGEIVSLVERAGELMGVADHNSLFFPGMYLRRLGYSGSYHAITPAQAARVLRLVDKGALPVQAWEVTLGLSA